MHAYIRLCSRLDKYKPTISWLIVFRKNTLMSENIGNSFIQYCPTYNHTHKICYNQNMINEELQIVSNLTGVAPEKIKFSDDGFLSRGYIIDNGRIVFKFKRNPNVSYKNEIKILNFVNSLNLNVNLQKVGWTSEDDNYLGIYGVIGKSLESIELTDDDRKNYGKQIGLFLRKLHSAKYENAEKFSVNEEIKAWQERFEKSKALLSRYFNDEEIEK